MNKFLKMGATFLMSAAAAVTHLDAAAQEKKEYEVNKYIRREYRDEELSGTLVNCLSIYGGKPDSITRIIWVDDRYCNGKIPFKNKVTILPELGKVLCDWLDNGGGIFEPKMRHTELSMKDSSVSWLMEPIFAEGARRCIGSRKTLANEYTETIVEGDYKGGEPFPLVEEVSRIVRRLPVAKM